MSDVFISYSREDIKKIEPLVKKLKEKGLSIFWDQDIEIGEDEIDSYIRKKIDNAKCMIVFWSNNSSQNSDWVIGEANLALKRKILVPVEIEPVRKPIRFESINAIEMHSLPKLPSDKEIEILIKGVRKKLAKASPFLYPTIEIKKSALCILGIILAFCLLYWNEGREFKTKIKIEQGADEAVSIQNDVISKDNDKSLVHISGILKPRTKLKDEEFNVDTESIKLIRDVKIFQWKEEETVDDNNEKKYIYEKVWSDIAIDSDNFVNKDEHENGIKRLPFISHEYKTKRFKIGIFNIDANISTDELVIRLNYLDKENVKIPKNTIRLLGNSVKIDNGIIYVGSDPQKAEINDIKISFFDIEPTKFTIIGMQSDNTIKEYYRNNDDSIFMSRKGDLTIAEMIELEKKENLSTAWTIRLFGVALIYYCFIQLLNLLPNVSNLYKNLDRYLERERKLISIGLTVAVAVLAIGLSWMLGHSILFLKILIISIIAITVLTMTIMVNKARVLASLNE